MAVVYWPLLLMTNCLFPGMFLSGLLIMAMDHLSGHTQSVTAFRIAGAIGYIAGLLLFWLPVLRWQMNALCWTLTESEIIRGRYRNLRFPLSSIIRIVPGLPDKLHPLIAVNRFLNPSVYLNTIAQRKGTLLIQFDDGRMLPLSLYECEGGTQLMAGLLNSCPHRVDLSYEYSSDEKRRLAFVMPNLIVRLRKRGAT